MALALALAVCLFPQYAPGGEWALVDSWVPNPDHRSSPKPAFASGLDADGDGWEDLLTNDFSGPGWSSQSGYCRLWSGKDGSLIWSTAVGTSMTEFGYSACTLDDVNHDGVPELAVSDPEHRNSSYSEGIVYVLCGRTGEPIREFQGWDPQSRFGHAIASAGDLDRDGIAELLISAPITRSGNTWTGELRAYSCVDGACVLAIKLPLPHYPDALGWAVLGPGDLDGDGVPDLVASSRFSSLDSSASNGAGVLFAFSGRSGAVLWTAGGSSSGAGFGTSLAGLPDLDDDQVPEIAVGSDYSSYPYLLPGRVELLSGRDGSRLWSLEGLTTGESFGSAMTTIADVDDDGARDLLVGAPNTRPPSGLHYGSVSLVGSRSGALLYRWENPGSWRSVGHQLTTLSGWQGKRALTFVVSGADRQFTSYTDSEHVLVVQRQPFLESSESSVSLSAGADVRLSLEFPASEATSPYLILGSLAGSGVTQLLGIPLPIRADALTTRMLAGLPSGVAGQRGVLDSFAKAEARLRIPPGAPASLAGRTAAYCALTHRNFLGVRSSLPVLLKLIP